MTIPQYKEKNTWNGWKITFEFSLVGAEILIQFKPSPQGRAVFEYSTSDGTLIIEDMSVSMTPRVLDYPTQLYWFDIRITQADGSIRNYGMQQIKIIPIVSN